jgi:8-oxo-dGTP pyrophosphatase MutT (NUDIX family)
VNPPADGREAIAANLAAFQRAEVSWDKGRAGVDSAAGGESSTSSADGADAAGEAARERAAGGLKPASVAVCVVETRNGLSLLITRRAARMRNHPGQWALPGGRRDPGETIEGAALRELREETGVTLGPDAVLGRLDDFVTRSGYVMSPVVVWGGPASPGMTGPAAEVAQIHVIPLADFDVPPRLLRIPESASPVIQLPLLGRWLHAPTAAIVYQFCQVGLHGQAIRVAHFEQPVFAWK